ncbi:MAG TPA: hypothetical protein VFN10_17545 [Thermoanaerobaculia bacterium]|nr:hypothetical protein [Thermoanaerobaculia bacterium]
MTIAAVTDKSVNLILSFEGLGQPCDWPGGESGITIGYGSDLGQCTQAEFQQQWGETLAPNDFTSLCKAIGVKGAQAQAIASEFKAIKIAEANAKLVFERNVLPVYQQRTATGFPGVEKLPPDAQGALVSLVFNRGISLTGSSRTEMKAIHDLLALDPQPHDVLAQIAAQVRAMKRLWPTVPGLCRRREAEAVMIENAQPAAT